MLVLSKPSIENRFTMREAILASKAALRLYSAKQTVVPLRINIDIPKAQGQSLFMPAYVEALDVIGIKIVSVFPNNTMLGKPSILGQMILMDGKTGEVLAMLDGAYLTQLRTGALQGAATDILARKDAKIAVLIGAGGQAPFQLEAMLTVRDLAEVRIVTTNYQRAQAFAALMQKQFQQFNTRIVAAPDVNTAISDADVITAVTTSKRPVFDGSLIKPGTHINGIGAYTKEMQELPIEAIQKADKIFFDTREGVLAEAGDIIIPMQAGKITEANFHGELGEVLLNTKKGRESDQEITLFKTVGTAILDIVTAHEIYKKCSLGAAQDFLASNH